MTTKPPAPDGAQTNAVGQASPSVASADSPQGAAEPAPAAPAGDKNIYQQFVEGNHTIAVFEDGKTLAADADVYVAPAGATPRTDATKYDTGLRLDGEDTGATDMVVNAEVAERLELDLADCKLKLQDAEATNKLLIRELAAARRLLVTMEERANKFKWQVRDTCARAEQAESAVADLRLECEGLRKDADYYKWRLKEIIPLFEKARDALPAISLVNAKLHGLDLSLGDKMDAAGTKPRADFDAALAARKNT